MSDVTTIWLKASSASRSDLEFVTSLRWRF